MQTLDGILNAHRCRVFLLIMLEQQILDKIAKKNKSLLDSLKVINLRLDGDYVIIRRKDSISAKLEDLIFKYDSAYQLWYKEKNESIKD